MDLIFKVTPLAYAFYSNPLVQSQAFSCNFLLYKFYSHLYLESWPLGQKNSMAFAFKNTISLDQFSHSFLWAPQLLTSPLQSTFNSVSHFLQLSPWLKSFLFSTRYKSTKCQFHPHHCPNPTGVTGHICVLTDSHHVHYFLYQPFKSLR